MAISSLHNPTLSADTLINSEDPNIILFLFQFSALPELIACLDHMKKVIRLRSCLGNY